MKHPEALQEYGNLNQNQLIQQLLQRDQEIGELKMKQNDNAQLIYNLNAFKQKLEEQIEQNEKSIKAFSKIIEISVAIIQRFSKFQSFNQSEGAFRASQKNQTIVKMFKERESVGLEDNSLNFDQLQGEFMYQTQGNCFDEIISETIRIMDYLAQISERICKNISDSQKMYQSSSSYKQIESLNKELYEKTIQNNALLQLVSNIEKQKQQILNKILNVGKQSEGLSKLQKKQLLQILNKLIFRVKQLEGSKMQNDKKNQVAKLMQKQKYISLLKQVKSLKLNLKLESSTSRANQST